MKLKKPQAAAFDKGQIPIISCVNRATVPLGSYSFLNLVAALQAFVDVHFAPVWGTPAKLVVATSSSNAVPNPNWALVFTDDADQADALGYHEYTPAGFPISHVFVKTTQAAGELVSVTASHELAEMLIDPAIQLMAANYRTGVIYAYEVADAVEQDSFLVNNIPMTNFQYPAWFESFRRPRSAKFDHMGLCTKPFEIRKGGYMSIFTKGQWSQVFGYVKTARAFKPAAHPRAAIRAARGKKLD